MVQCKIPFQKEYNVLLFHVKFHNSSLMVKTDYKCMILLKG